ncbi:MAG: hypothetical protein CM1200mP3_13650 [Chloroflexota bacterium]|nr:MAG: hypothetical protein CM1200mP3_13650 [Chloroflexota bacterium]
MNMFEGQVVLVTGGATGIGRSISKLSLMRERRFRLWTSMSSWKIRSLQDTFNGREGNISGS